MRPLNIRRDNGIKCGCIPNIKSTPFWWAWLRNSAGLRCAHTFDRFKGWTVWTNMPSMPLTSRREKRWILRGIMGLNVAVRGIMGLNVAVSQISNPLLFGEHGCEIVLACAVRILFSFKAWTVFNKGHGGATHDYRDEQTRWILSGIIMDLIF